MKNIEFVQSLFIYQADHYFCVRRFDGTPNYFFIIDSLKPSLHQTIKQEEIRQYINYIHEYNGSIYIPVSACILQMETICSEVLYSAMRPLPISEADKITFKLNEDRAFCFNCDKIAE